MRNLAKEKPSLLLDKVLFLGFLGHFLFMRRETLGRAKCCKVVAGWLDCALWVLGGTFFYVRRETLGRAKWDKVAASWLD